MDFDDEDALRYYYQHPLHSEEREKLYRLLNPLVCDRFDAASRLSAQERARIFEQIEAIIVGGNHILRLDTVTDMPLSCLIDQLSS
jgi:hypothetical protein